MTEQQKFPRTAQVINEIGMMLSDLQRQLSVKKNALGQQKQAYKHNMAEKNAQLETYGKVAAEALVAVSRATAQIDEVLKENGNSNDNN